MNGDNSSERDYDEVSEFEVTYDTVSPEDEKEYWARIAKHKKDMIQYMLLGDIIRDMSPDHQFYDDLVNLNSKTKKRVVNGLNKANQFKQSKII